MGNNAGTGWKGWQRHRLLNVWAGNSPSTGSFGGDKDYGMPPTPVPGPTAAPGPTYGPADAPIPTYGTFALDGTGTYLYDQDGNPVFKLDEDGNPILDADGNPIPVEPPIFEREPELAQKAWDALLSGDYEAFVGALIDIQRAFVDYDLDVVDYAQKFFLHLETAFNDLKLKLRNVDDSMVVELSQDERKLLEIGIKAWDESGRPPSPGYNAAKKLLAGEKLSREEALEAATFLSDIQTSVIPTEFQAEAISNRTTNADQASDRILDNAGLFGLMSL